MRISVLETLRVMTVVMVIVVIAVMKTVIIQLGVQKEMLVQNVQSVETVDVQQIIVGVIQYVYIQIAPVMTIHVVIHIVLLVVIPIIIAVIQ